MSQPDLTPRPVGGSERKSLKNRTLKKSFLSVFLVCLLGGLGFLVYTTLSDSSLFFLDVDDAVERQESLGQDRFRMQGIIVPDSIDITAELRDLETGEQESVVAFRVAFNGESTGVLFRGKPAELFANCLPVIIEGQWKLGQSQSYFGENYYFLGDDMLVKHDNNYKPSDGEGDNSYRQENPDRVEDAVGSEEGADPLRACPQV